MGITITAAGAFRETGASFFFPEGRTYSPLPEGQRWYPSRWSGRALFSKHPPDASPEGGSQCRSFSNCLHCLCGWQTAFASFASSLQIVVLCRDNLPPACENLPPAALSQLWTMPLRHRPFSFVSPKETKPPLAVGQKGSERLWRSITWKRRS